MKLKIALLCGGYSGEDEVSYNSAAFVEESLNAELYDVYKIKILPRDWFYESKDGNVYPIDKGDFSLNYKENKIHFDLIFMMIHGSPGENGLLQGYFEMLGLPYTCCDSLTSSLTMNKAYTKAVLRGISDMYLANSVQLFEQDQKEAVEIIENKLKLPIFVKPNGGGSSIGMSKVEKPQDIKAAVDLAFSTENTGKQVLVEEFVSGREFSVGVYRFKDGVKVLPATEVITSRDFFDYKAKYIAGLTEEITPAEINEEQVERMERIVKEIYLKLNCKGLVRIDFFFEHETGNFYFIEINTIPGQTKTSFIPQQIRATGKTERAFYTEWIESSLVSLPSKD
ncbi:D-alanine--D-alanine ligase [Albibacterium sp.]|uniref:D-alanine--D-alanine ligase n=1 Tax=Albibacterium sp. TaxID=2952885 RepID=UPI002BBEC0F0|nr:D-alanine--D-alanine ligase [Albibacterium sp.]HUH18869.1 D-alanine--D-alanine ligase [Albibacterium sp.]